MDWSITARLVHYAIMRAGFGDAGHDSKLDTYRTDIAATPMVYGLYWFVRVGQSWQTHVATFKSLWEAAPGILPPVMDLEYTTLSPQETTTWVHNLLLEWEQQTGVRPMIYTSPGWWNEHTVANNWAGNYLLWNAHWTDAEQPIIPRDFAIWKYWQYSADGNGLGRLYGSLDGDVDMDLDKYNGSLDAFNAEYGTNLVPLQPPLPDPIVPLKYVVVTAGALNMRSLPTVDSTDIGTIRSGDDVPVVDVFDTWYKISGWISGRYTRDK